MIEEAPVEALLRCEQQVHELTGLLEASALGMRSLVALPDKLHAAVHVDESGASAWPSFNEDVEEAERLAGIATHQERRAFRDLYAQGVVTLWAHLEIGMDEFFAEWLTAFPEASLNGKLQNVKIQVSVYDALTGEAPREVIRALKEPLRRKCGGRQWDGIGRFELVLTAIGVRGAHGSDESGSEPEVATNGMKDVRRDLTALWATRNALVHHGGRATSFFKACCPWVEIEVGEEILVTEGPFLQFARAARHYCGEVASTARRRALVLGQERGS